ncbi:putative reverse transcriptase domain-containing protein, partial [Tanacetum coccineum]
NVEYDISIWPKLKGDVDDFMENIIYPSKEIRAEWSPRQMEYFYNNCHKFHLDPSYEDGEDNVNSNIDGIAVDMKPEFEVDNADSLVNDSTAGQDEDNYSICGLLETHVKKKNLARICRRVLGVDSPWVILGDFNACLDPFERSSGCSKITTAMSDFRECVADIEVEDIDMNGLKFTWNKKPGKVGGLLNKLDRVMAVLIFPDILKSKPKPFKFHNYLSSKDKFLPTVSKGNLFDNVKRCKADLSSAQAAMCTDPFNVSLREREFVSLKAFKSALKDEESFLKQKAKVLWLDEGDRNSKYFHNVVKGGFNRNGISYVKDIDGDA